MHRSLAFSLMIVIFVVGVGVGYFLTPEYEQMREQRGTGMMELGPADRNLDQRYIDGMIAHHLAAIDLMKQAQANTNRAELKELAQTVILADQADIQKLYELKKELYGSTRPVTQYRKVHLGAADDTFDLRFLNALLAHHAEAIEVAKEVQTKSSRSEILNISDTVIQALSASTTQLQRWREEWYGIK